MRRRIRQKTKDPKPRIKPVQGDAKRTVFDDAESETHNVCEFSGFFQYVFLD